MHIVSVAIIMWCRIQCYMYLFHQNIQLTLGYKQMDLNLRNRNPEIQSWGYSLFPFFGPQILTLKLRESQCDLCIVSQLKHPTCQQAVQAL